MENESKPMGAVECLATLNAGGWMVTGGREVGPSGLTMMIPMLEAMVVGDKIRIATAQGLFYEAPTSNITSSDNGQRIMILGVYTKREQKKLLDGGGWRDVEYTAPALKFQTLASLIEADHAREEKQKRAEEELKKWREEEQRRNEAEALFLKGKWQARRQEFAHELSDKFVGKKIVSISPAEEDSGHILQFEDGSKLSVCTDMGSDHSRNCVCFCGYCFS